MAAISVSAGLKVHQLLVACPDTRVLTIFSALLAGIPAQMLCLSLLSSWQARSVSKVHAIPSSSPQPMVGRSRSVHTPDPSSLVLRNFAIHARQRPQWD